nr:MAG TPA: hypothetical protein [Caudoviricetes sp.]
MLLYYLFCLFSFTFLLLETIHFNHSFLWL